MSDPTLQEIERFLDTATPEQTLAFVLGNFVCSEFPPNEVRLASPTQTSQDGDDINIIQSNGRSATQTVPHVHFHVAAILNPHPAEGEKE